MSSGNAPGGRALDVDAVLFDLDGTLVDTAPDLAGALNRVRQDRGLPPLPLDVLRPHASCGARGLIAAGFERTPDHPDFPTLRDTFLAHYENGLCVASALFEGVEEVLEAIAARGMPWGIVTNKATRYTVPLLDELALPRKPAVVVCGDTTTHAKPHPAPLFEAASRLAIEPSRIVYVGDAERDVRAALAAGMLCLVAAYGYIEPHEQPDTWPADGWLAEPRDLLDWLPGHRAA